MMIIDIEKAWERIYYEEIISALDNRGLGSQQLLFPYNLHFSQAEAELLTQAKPLLSKMGFTLDNLSPNTFVVQGIPQGMAVSDIQNVIENIVHAIINQGDVETADLRIPVARSLALNMAFRQLKIYKQEEMRSLTDRLFATSMPSVSPSGKNIVRIVSEEELSQLFK